MSANKLLLLLIIPLFFSCNNNNKKIKELEEKIIDLERQLYSPQGHEFYKFYEFGGGLDKEDVQGQGFYITVPWKNY